MKEKRKLLLFALLVGLAYLPSLNHQFLSDDIAGIVNNPDFLKFDLDNFLKRPFQFFIFMRWFLIYHLFGLKPVFFRLSNLLFHLGSVILVDKILLFLTNPNLALATAAVFAVHPVLTESITWISGGVYPQYSFFILLSFFFYLSSEKNKKFFFLSLLAFGAGLLSSEKAIVLPLIIFFFELSQKNLSKNWRKITPFFSLGFLSMLVLFKETIWRVNTLEQVNYLRDKTFQNPFFQLPAAISSYFELIFWPKNLTFYHSEMFFSKEEYFLRLGFFISFILALFYFLKKNRFLFFWLIFFLIALSPTLTPLKIAWIVAERYVYLGTIGVIVFALFLIQKFCPKKSFWPIIITIIFLLLLRTLNRNLDWKNQDTLWLATAKTSPSSSQNHNNLGDLYTRRGDLQKAAQEFKMAIELKPDYGDAYHNLANTYWQMGKITEAIENYQNAIKTNHNLWQSYQNLGAIYLQQKKLDLAKENFKKALEINPNNPKLQQILYNLPP